MAYKVNFLAHMRAVRECMQRHGLQIEFDFDTFKLKVWGPERRCELIPQFLYAKDGVRCYAPNLSAHTNYFIGWLPYFGKRWEIGSGKLPFKQYCAVHDVRTPRMFERLEEADVPVLYKPARTSFGAGIRGPFRAGDVSGMDAVGEEGFLEEFMAGDIAKIWYWNGKPVCLEMLAMPAVQGNGHGKLRQLIEAARRAHTDQLDWPLMETIARYQGLTLDSVVPQGQRVMVDFRYISPLHPRYVDNRNLVEPLQGSPVMAQLERAGRIFWSGIPEETRHDILFTLDAIVDDESRVWFLEMNCNPMGHPDIYAPMFESLFGPRRAGSMQTLEPDRT